MGLAHTLRIERMRFSPAQLSSYEMTLFSGISLAHWKHPVLSSPDAELLPPCPLPAPASRFTSNLDFSI